MTICNTHTHTHSHIVKLTLSTIIGGSCPKYHFCHDKTCFFVVTKWCLSWQNFVMTNLFLSRQKFCCKKYLSQQTFCCDKSFVATNTCLSWKPPTYHHVLCCNKNMLIVTKRLSRQTCLWQSFVTTSILLSRQKNCFVMTNTWHLWQLPPIIVHN